ncbi:hypothetical protein DL769_005213 [Monosporascus sp. CRB-8-3]|nr:hypothetical protein DL769_005213 [Monosporascus sp. CRB-8-3]
MRGDKGPVITISRGLPDLQSAEVPVTAAFKDTVGNPDYYLGKRRAQNAFGSEREACLFRQVVDPAVALLVNRNSVEQHSAFARSEEGKVAFSTTEDHLSQGGRRSFFHVADTLILESPAPGGAEGREARGECPFGKPDRQYGTDDRRRREEGRLPPAPGTN